MMLVVSLTLSGCATSSFVVETTTGGQEEEQVQKIEDAEDVEETDAEETISDLSELDALGDVDIELDLDDGVKVNYEKAQTVRDGKKYQVLVKI